MDKIIIIAGSPEPDMEFLKTFDYSASIIIAVDKGLEFCHALTLIPSMVIGDLDSVSPAILSTYDKSIIKQFPVDKSESDLELAVTEVLGTSLPIVILNAYNGRIDHVLFNTMVLFLYPGRITIIDRYGCLTAIPVKKDYFPDLKDGQVFSVIPIGTCNGVSIENAKYPLHSLLLSNNSLTLSNISSGKTKIFYTEGYLLLFSARI